MTGVETLVFLLLLLSILLSFNRVASTELAFFIIQSGRDGIWTRDPSSFNRTFYRTKLPAHRSMAYFESNKVSWYFFYWHIEFIQTHNF